MDKGLQPLVRCGEKNMKAIIRLLFFGSIITVLIAAVTGDPGNTPGADTAACIECHSSIHPGIVEDWNKSLHSKIKPADAEKKQALQKRITSPDIPGALKQDVVGCAECHTLNPAKHADTFEHNGYKVHAVVTPEDCAVCHKQEKDQYLKNIMSCAFDNLKKNKVYNGLEDSINGNHFYSDKNEIKINPPDDSTSADSCYYCHGTEVKVKSFKTRETEMGEMTFPVLTGWPNQGVGRINPDGSKGSCASCHSRHNFTSETARKPYSCSECHKGPDVPAYSVYMVSKHGNLFATQKDWNFKAVPWTAGKDFTAPTCATCHVSRIVNLNGDIIAERTHQMSDRLSWRIFGLPYAHPHPESPDTTIITNKAGLQLPTELTGEPSAKYLITLAEQKKRRTTMENICSACHSREWTDGHFTRFENTIKETNSMTLATTKILLRAWGTGAAKGLDKNDSIFNEAIEKMWVEQWLFFANSTRFSSAMTGADYGVFANGRWYMSKNIQEMNDWLDFILAGKKKSK